MSHKILFLVAHRPGRSPGQRFRFEQYLDHLRKNGFEYQISYLIDEKDDLIFYAEGKYFHKFMFLLKSLWHRWKDIQMLGSFDLVFLYREAHMMGTTFFEKRMKKAGAKMVLDFDDSIWLKDVSNGNKKLAFLKKPSKTKHLVAMADACIVGNQYLADYASKYNHNVFVVPTTIDTNQYQVLKKNNNSKKICIGWTGSSTTLKHFSLAVPFLQKLKDKYGDRICFRMISDQPYEGTLADLENIRWSRETEIEDLSAIDIGIMPLPNDPWSKGKCGFKGLQYMALEIPAVMSPVGVNNDIIVHGLNGFLASDEKQWVEILSKLIEDKELRKTTGARGRKTVEEKYSYDSQKERYVRIFRDLVKGAEKPELL
ncbi:MAG: glycosyltransferase family 4 protein [Bacteroidales bacterium]